MNKVRDLQLRRNMRQSRDLMRFKLQAAAKLSHQVDDIARVVDGAQITSLPWTSRCAGVSLDLIGIRWNR
jgi:hypothetical protein